LKALSAVGYDGSKPAPERKKAMRAIRHLLVDRNVLAVEAEMTVMDAARYMIKHVIGAAPVLDKERLVGIFTERDLMSRVVVAGKDPKKTSVREVMTKDVVAADPDERYTECIAKMKKVHCRHLPIVEDGHLVGTISLRDLLAVDIKRKEADVKFLTEYVQYVPPGGELSRSPD
jgi:CBS domain-containing protein